MFSTASAWIMSIAGIICLSVLVELVMPEGQLAKYIKGVFSFIILFVIISPIPKILNNEINISSFLEYSDVELQEDYLYQVNIYKLSAIQKDIEKEVETAGYKEIIVSISADVFSEKIVFKRVYVDLKDLVISRDAPHKNILDIEEDIRVIVLKHVDVEREVIYFER